MASRYEGLLEGLLPSRPTLERRAVLNHIRGYGVAVMFVALFVALAITTSAFLTTDNLRNLLEQSAQIGLIACGATLVIIAGQFDLSSGAIYSFAGVVAIIVTGESTVVLGMLAGLVASVVIGFANGLLVTRVGIDSFLATLASGFVLVGLGIVVASGVGTVRTTATDFDLLGRGSAFSLKYEAYALVGVTILAWLVLRFTAFGRQIYAVGGNLEAARVAGVKVGQVRALTLVIGGLTAALAGLLQTSEIRVAQVDAGVSLTLPAIAAVIIGGTSVAGGKGGVWRTLIGVLFVTMVGNGFNLLRIDSVYQSIFTGGIIVLAVAVDSWSKLSSRS